MLQSAKIKIRSLKELQADNFEHTDASAKTPFKKRKKLTPASTTKKQTKQDADKNSTVFVTKATPRTANKFHLNRKELPSSQKRIDSFFKSSPKNFKFEPFEVQPPTTLGQITKQLKTKKECTTTKKSTSSTQRRPQAGRKRLFVEPAEISTETETICSNQCKKEFTKTKMIDCITIDSDSDDLADNSEVQKNLDLNVTPTENELPAATIKNIANDRCTTRPKSITRVKEDSSVIKETSTLKQQKSASQNKSPLPNENSSAKTLTASIDRISVTPNSSLDQQISYTSCSETNKSSSSASNTAVTKRKSKPCPPYKIIEDTSFAVDAFQFGYIDNVSHYFLTHFHADHYIGLTRKFSMPLYMSQITARFVRAFIPIDEAHINELELNKPVIIDNIEITALDANHCPGAVLLVFKFLNTGKCILHTGDFRAWHGMESEPIFWNNDIHTIYLDTTYISDKYNFCTQHESIEKAKSLIETFQEKHRGKRILYICGSYVIGKEKFWSSLAEKYEMKVWTEGNRNKALKAMADERLNSLLIDDPYQANMHVITLGKLGYLHLVDYFSQYEQHYDMVFAIRPSGWEKKSTPQYRGKINIIGIEYSEHSSFSEMQRFVKFLKPQQVLSTVPTGRDLMVTAEIPQTWYKYDALKSSSNYQPSIDTYFGPTPLKKNIRAPNLKMGGVENFVSPLSLANTAEQSQSNISNEDKQQVISINSSENEFEQDLIAVKQKPKAAMPTKIRTRILRSNLNKQNQVPNANSLQQENKELGNLERPKNILNKKFKKKSPIAKRLKNSANLANIEKQENDNKATKISTTPVIQNSSEDFEMPQIVSTIKKKPLNKNLKSNLTTTTEYASAIGSNIKKKLIFEEPNTKLKEIPDKSANSRVTKFKFQEQTFTTTASEEDFEISQHQSSKRMNLRTSKHINNFPSLKSETQNSVTTSSDNDTEISITQKPHGIINNNLKQNSLTRTSDEKAEVRVFERIRNNNSNSKTATFKNKEQEKEQEKELEKTQLFITKQQSSINKPPINPLLKSNTTSSYSSSTDELPILAAKQTTPRLLRKKRNGLTQTSHTPTPFKKSKDRSTAVKEHHISLPYPECDIICTSDEDTTALHSTLNNNQKSKDASTGNDKKHLSSTHVNSNTLLDEILYNNKDIDFYNPSQMFTIVEESLSKQCLDTSNDHMPRELLSDLDADDDWM